jgi:phosphatidylserine/phosphatidylglycerophosphate/cardiolipin synthase-like enzyme
LKRKIILVAGVLILWSCVLTALPANDVKVITNRDYFPAVIELFENAQESIYVFMFSARIYIEYPDDVNWELMRGLVAAKKRGVDVKVILDASSWNTDNTFKNKHMADSLTAGGVEVYYDPLDVTSHPKLLIVDHRYTVVGSTNWSYYAIELNNEASVVIDSEPVAAAFEEWFNKNLDLSSTKLKMKNLE